MNIVFRVDSSTQMGIGHLMRCITLADELKKKEHQSTFICRALPGNLISSTGHNMIALPKDENFRSDDLYLNWLGATQEQDAEQTIVALPEGVDMIVVDNYALDKEWHQMLRTHTKKIVVIDDLADRQFDCDILLNQNLGTQKEDYKDKVPSNCGLLLGCDYALLRPEFAKLRPQALKKRSNTKEIKNILVSMGGSDIDNITYDVLQQLDNNFNTTVVLGRLSPYNKMIEDYARGKNIKVIINAKNMAELMFETDLAIGAGGATSWERCCLGLPTLLYVFADNQRMIAENLKGLGAVTIVKNLQDNMRVMLDNFRLWEIMSYQGQNICDGMGAIKVSNRLCQI